MPSASTQPACGSTTSTSRKALTSRRRRSRAARSRKRFEVSFFRASAPLPCLSCAISASFFLVCGLALVEEVPGHGVARARDVALGEHDLEKVGAARRRAEHLGAAVEVHAPDAAEALVEALRVERADALPVAVEALGPHVEGERVVAAQVLDVEHLEPSLLHRHDHLGEARDPAAGEYVLADEEVGLGGADVSDEVDQAEAAGLEELRVRADHLAELVASRVLEAADAHHFVELLRACSRVCPEVRVHLDGVLDAELLDLPARVLGLRAGGVDARDVDAVVHRGMHKKAAKAAADVDHFLARLEQYLARDMVGLCALRLLQSLRAVAPAVTPVRAGVEQVRIVQPELVELWRQRVVELGVAVRAPAVRVRMRELVPAVAQAHEPGRIVRAAFHAGGERPGEAAL